MAACAAPMKFTEPLNEGQFLKRYKRFFADLKVNGQTTTAHVPNTGSLKSCLEEGAPCRFSTSADPTRKLPHTLQMIKTSSGWVGVNTHLANDLVWEAWTLGLLPRWKDFDSGQREVKLHAKTRIDLALWKSSEDLPAGTKLTPPLIEKSRLHFVEVKNVTLREGGLALFPDAVTERGQKHLKELMELVQKKHTAEILFLVQRDDCQAFAPADHIDPIYGKLLRQAIKAGVQISAYPCELKKEEARLLPRLLPLEI